MGANPLAPECDQVVALFETEFRLTATRMGFGIESRLSRPSHGIAPASDGTGEGLDVSGYPTDAPAGLQQGDSDATSHFELNGCAFGSHEALIGRRDLGL